MDHAYIATNDFGETEKADALALLKEGKAVRVIASCIGHTRAQMIETASTRFFKEVGAKPIDIEFKSPSIEGLTWTEQYWTL